MTPAQQRAAKRVPYPTRPDPTRPYPPRPYPTRPHLTLPFPTLPCPAKPEPRIPNPGIRNHENLKAADACRGYDNRHSSQFKNNHFTEMCGLRLKDLLEPVTRVTKKKKKIWRPRSRAMGTHGGPGSRIPKPGSRNPKPRKPESRRGACRGYDAHPTPRPQTLNSEF